MVDTVPDSWEVTSVEAFAAALGPAAACGEVDSWAAVPLTEFSDAGQADALATLRGLECEMAARRLAVVAAIAARGAAGRLDPDNPCAFDWTPQTVSTLLRVSLYAADRLVSLATDLASRFPSTLRAMAEARVSEFQARVLHEETGGLDVEVARAVEARVLPNAHRQDRAAFRRSVLR